MPPKLSVEADQERLILVQVETMAEKLVGTVGGVISGTTTVTVFESALEPKVLEQVSV
mgnify:CR=1 FL=1